MARLHFSAIGQHLSNLELGVYVTLMVAWMSLPAIDDMIAVRPYLVPLAVATIVAGIYYWFKQIEAKTSKGK